ncbi:MAG: hypothetical protein FJX77_15735, partial [Armatimonadetes bacterium]|nr:hypothetical protein [Armatimonadota bacterium]
AALISYPVDAEVRRVLEGGPGGAVDLTTPRGTALRVAVGPLQVGGQRAGALVLLHDVSELRRVDAMRRDFVANVSHELRTPVAAIRALVETIQLRGARRPELVGEYAPRVAGECERLDRLVQDLLLLAETESGGLRLKLEAVDPQEVAEEVGRLLAPVLEGGRVRLCLGPGAGVLVRADRRALEQCLRNLVENAVRYAPEGEITVSSRAEGAHVVLSVVDQGPGIPPEALPRIFERFYRVDQARTREAGSLPGSGLGLAIVRHLVEVQGGRVWVESVVGKGSRFHLELPRALPAEPAEQGTGS